MLCIIVLLINKGRPNVAAMNPVHFYIEENILDNLKVKTKKKPKKTITTDAVKDEFKKTSLGDKFSIKN